MPRFYTLLRPYMYINRAVGWEADSNPPGFSEVRKVRKVSLIKKKKKISINRGLEARRILQRKALGESKPGFIS